MIAYSNLIKAQVKWSQRFIDYLKTSCQAYGTLQDRNVSASKAWIMYQSANYKWKHKKRLRIHHLQAHSPANPMLTMLCCTSDNQQWTLHLAHLSAGYATLLKRQEHPNGKTARTILFSSEDHLAPAKLKGLDLPMELEDITQSLYPIWSNWIIAQIQLQCIYWISLRTYFAGKSCLNDKTTYCCQYCVILQNFRYCTNPFGVNVIATLKYKRLQGFSMYTYPL